MSLPRGRRFQDRIAKAREQLQGQGRLPFRELLPAELIDGLLEELGVEYRDRIYTPAVTLWTFLSQVLSADHSCREAVARVLADRAARGEQPCSPNTGAYCTARGRLPEGMFPELVKATGTAAQRDVAAGWLWKGRHVKIVDGSTVTLADTPENQAEYPQPRSQAPGAGFPIVRLVVVLSLAVGTVLEYALGPCRGKQTGENQLFRALMGGLSRGEIVLADRYYASWWDFALLQACGVDLVARLHQHRRADFRKGLRLGKGDHLVFWKKPPRPEWLAPEIYDALPQQLVIREVKVRIECDGFRVQEYVVVTTLYDHELYTAAELADLYRARWHAELDLRSIKITMQMDHLRCRTPEMVRKELAMHLMAYNLIRTLIVHAARVHTVLPRAVSFKGALQTVKSFHDRGLLQDPTPQTLAALLTAIATHRVGDRPDRIEPRLVKRRPKQYKHLKEPRSIARTRLCGRV